MASRKEQWRIDSTSLKRPALPLLNSTNDELQKRYVVYLVAQRYARSTRDHYSKAAFLLCDYLKEQSLSTVTHMDVRAFLSEFARRDLSPDGVSRCLWALRNFFDFLYLGGVVDSIAPRLIRGRRVQRKLPRVLSERDVLRLIESAQCLRDKAMFELLYASGCRIGELLGMRVEDVSFERGAIRVKGKNGDPSKRDTQMRSRSRARKSLVPSLDAACPCGSGRTFSSCCEPLLQQHTASSSLSGAADAKYKEGNFALAEALYRANLTQYLQWIYDHTLPAIQAKMPIADQLIDVDRDALVELAFAVSDCMARAGHAAEILPFLNHLESTVPIVGFKKDASYLRASWRYIALDDQTGARSELQKIGPIIEYGRRKALELYLDVYATELSQREKISIAENIIGQSGMDLAVRIQYTAIKTIALLQIGEGTKGIQELEALLLEIDSSYGLDAADTHTVWQLAKAWGLYGNLKNDDSALSRAEQLFLSIREKTLTPFGKAQLFLEKGWIFKDREKYIEATNAFRRSLEIASGSVAKIHLLHSLALSGKGFEARTLLRQIEGDEHGPNLLLEFLRAKGSVAIAIGDNGIAKETIVALKAIQISEPFWVEQHDQLLIQMLEFLQQPDSAPPTTRLRRIAKLLLSVNEILELKPNVAGLGVNVNRMFEKLARRLDASDGV
jgi:Phage integrase family/Phage integrase, N-terminal SAM-like domain/SEC-C motif